MKNHLALFWLLVFGYLISFQTIANGQTVGEKITVEEKKAAREIADRFESRLGETGDIDSVAREMFVVDFVARQIKESKAGRAAEKVKQTSFLLIPGIECDASVVDKATEEDWHDLYSRSFNFMQFASVLMMNKWTPRVLKGDDLNDKDDEELQNDITSIFPKNLVTLFNRHSILRNFIERKDYTPNTRIKNVAELRSVSATLEEGLQLWKNTLGGTAKMSADTQKIIRQFRERPGDELGPWLNIADRETYGFPKGTRIIVLFSSPFHELTMVKVDDKYKLVDARLSSPD